LTDWQRVDERGWIVATTVTLLAIAAIMGYYYSARRSLAPMLSAGAAVIAAFFMPPSTPPASPDAAALAAGQVTIDGALEIPDAEVRATIARRAGRVPVGGALVLRREPPADVSVSLTIEGLRIAVAGEAFAGKGVAYCCEADEAADGRVVSGRFPRALQRRPGGLARPPSAFATLAVDTAGRVSDRAVAVHADVRLRFVRHRLAGSLPVRAGVAFRGDGYLLEIVSLDERTGTASIRLSRFPSLARIGPTLRLFRDFDGLPLASTPWAPHALGFERRHAGPSHGRDWVTGTTLPVAIWIGDVDQPQRARTLAIVESTPIGELDSELAAENVLVVESTRPLSLGRRF
jgi:hypothetical protein